ncbi:MAG: hypothetical protein HQL94_00670 [Magnetococcales bacterium]|nr:hypothetical protein [Magnetococcales bacterium]
MSHLLSSLDLHWMASTFAQAGDRDSAMQMLDAALRADPKKGAEKKPAANHPLMTPSPVVSSR